MSIARAMALSEVTSRPHLKFEVRVTGDMAFSGIGEGFVLWVENRLMFDGGCGGEIKIPALNAASDAAFRTGYPDRSFPYCAGVSDTAGAAGASAVTSGATTGLIFTVARICSRRLKILSRSTCLMTPSSEATVVTFRANS